MNPQQIQISINQNWLRIPCLYHLWTYHWHFIQLFYYHYINNDIPAPVSTKCTNSTNNYAIVYIILSSQYSAHRALVGRNNLVSNEIMWPALTKYATSCMDKCLLLHLSGIHSTFSDNHLENFFLECVKYMLISVCKITVTCSPRTTKKAAKSKIVMQPSTWQSKVNSQNSPS